MRPYLLKFLFLLITGVLTGCGPASDHQQSIELKLKKFAGDLKVIEIEKDGQSHMFLYDTGGGYTVLDRSAAEAFGCSPYGRTFGFRLSGEQVEFQNCNRINLEFGEITVTLAPKVMDLNSLLPEGLPELAGVVSLQTFREFPLIIDYANGFITLETPENFIKRTSEMREIPLRVTEEMGAQAVTIFTRVLENPEPLWFYLDSGNLRGVLVAPHAAPVLGLRNEGTITLDLSGASYQTRAEVYEMIYDGALDVEFFKAHVIALDLANARAWVKKTE